MTVNPQISQAVNQFALQLDSIFREQMRTQMLSSLDAMSKVMAGAPVKMGGTVGLPTKRRGRPPGSGKLGAVAVEKVEKKARKPMPVQLCPVPGCTKVAAPAYRMVCADHKGIAKSKIKAFREARRAAKANGGVNPKVFQPVKAKGKGNSKARATGKATTKTVKRAKPAKKTVASKVSRAPKAIVQSKGKKGKTKAVHHNIPNDVAKSWANSVRNMISTPAAPTTEPTSTEAKSE